MSAGVAVGVGCAFTVSVAGRLHIFKVVDLSLQLPGKVPALLQAVPEMSATLPGAGLAPPTEPAVAAANHTQPSPPLPPPNSQNSDSKTIGKVIELNTRAKLVAFYRAYNPDKLPGNDHHDDTNSGTCSAGVDAILIKYAGKEEVSETSRL